MNWYKDTQDFTPGYNPIISDTRIPEEYIDNQEKVNNQMLDCIDYIDCLFDNPPENCKNYSCPLHI